MDSIPWDHIGVGSGWALVALFVVLVYRGILIPRRTYEDVMHDRDEWRAAHRISETARQVGQDQVAELLEHARTTDAFIRALPHPERDTR